MHEVFSLNNGAYGFYIVILTNYMVLGHQFKEWYEPCHGKFASKLLIKYSFNHVLRVCFFCHLHLPERETHGEERVDDMDDS